MSLLLTSPAYLLGLRRIRWGFGRSRLVTGAGLAVLIDRPRQPDALQPGLGPVRLSLQPRLRAVGAAPRRDRVRADRRGGPGGDRRSFGAVALARGIAGRSLALALVGLAVLLVVGSILVNLWGVVWGDALGW